MKIGLIGRGQISKAHEAAYARIPDAEIVAVCDSRADHAYTFLKEWGLDLPAYDNMEELIENEKERIELENLARLTLETGLPQLGQ